MECETTSLPGVLLLKPRVFADDRGYFLETWQARSYQSAGVLLPFVQDNHSHSVRHVLRGLHYQICQPQGKLVRVVSGEVFDVAVDMRRSSATLGHWFGIVLSSKNGLSMWVPPGFAHGFLALSDEVDFLYKCTDYYSPEHERAVRWDDPTLGIRWPLAAGAPPKLSGKDAAAPLFGDAECFP